MAGFFSLANGKKTWYYLKKNGIKSACLAVLERLEERKQPPYQYTAPTKEALAKQRAEALAWETVQDDARLADAQPVSAAAKPVRFSILVPAYETNKKYLEELLNCVRDQSWPYWELVIADAGSSDQVHETLCAWANEHGVAVIESAQQSAEGVKSAQQDMAAVESTEHAAAGAGAAADTHGFRAGAVRYVKLKKNGGISENTNAALSFAYGDYTGLLDHDDLLCADALFEMAAAIKREKERGKEAELLYSDEDKCDGSGEVFYEPHRKTDFDPELLLTNNYICHFMVMKTEMLKQLKVRTSFDGAQDFDLVLRALLAGLHFVHVPKVLYHWRCHTDSTAANPRSKSYAYEAGKRAVEDFCAQKGWQVTVTDTEHLGFYRVNYADLWRDRPEIGAVAYPVHKNGKMYSGIYERDGQIRFAGLWSGFSGYIHRAVLQQSAEVADVRQMKVRPGQEAERLAAVKNCGIMNPRTASQEFCRQLADRGQRILWDPEGK